MAATVSVSVDQKELDRAMRRLARYEGRPLQRRAEQAYIEGARLLRSPMRAAAPVGPTGNLRKSVSARKNRRRPGEIAAATVGTRFKVARHRHLVVAGTKPHPLTGVRRQSAFARFPDGEVRRFAGFSHPGSRANPFVEEVANARADNVRSWINERVLDLGETFKAY